MDEYAVTDDRLDQLLANQWKPLQPWYYQTLDRTAELSHWMRWSPMFWLEFMVKQNLDNKTILGR